MAKWLISSNPYQTDGEVVNSCYVNPPEINSFWWDPRWSQYILHFWDHPGIAPETAEGLLAADRSMQAATGGGNLGDFPWMKRPKKIPGLAWEFNDPNMEI